MSLTDVLNNLAGASKNRFLEDLLPRATTLNDTDSEIVIKAAFGVSIDLGVRYLLARGKDEEAVTALEEAAAASEKIAQRRRYTAVAELCMVLGMKDRAANNYERVGTIQSIQKAAEIYLGIKYNDPFASEWEITEFKERVTELEKVKKHTDAAELCKKYGMTIRAVKNLRLAGNDQKADDLEKNSNPLKAAEVWERNAHITKACYTAAVGLLYRNDLFKEMAATQERVADLVSAGNTYYNLLHDLDSALRCYIKAKCDLSIEKILREQGRLSELVAHWQETGNTSNLARHFEDNDPKKAAGFYMELKEFGEASRCLIRAGKPLEAIELLVHNELYEHALGIASAINSANPSEQARIEVLTATCYTQLASRYETTNPKKALEFYSKLNQQEDVRRVATNLMAQAANKGDFSIALKYAGIARDNKAIDTFKAAVSLLNPAS